MQDMRSHTEQLKPTNVEQNGNVEFSMAPQIVAVEHHKDYGARVSGRRSRH